MEEKNQVKQEQQTPKKEKLTYEQLEAFAQQTVAQAKQVYQENQALKRALDEARYHANSREIDHALKCLDHAEMFSPEFIKSVIERLEIVLSPVKPEEQAEPEKKEETE